MRFWAIMFVMVALLTGQSADQKSSTQTVPDFFALSEESHAKPSPYFINLDSVYRVVCKNADGTGSIGTAELIDADTLITAHHVVAGTEKCYIDGAEAKIVLDQPELDFAVLKYPTGYEPRFPYSCKGFAPGETYFAIGHAKGKDFAITQLVATDAYQNRRDHISGQPFIHVRMLRGKVYQGQSGGPIVGLDGVQVGTIVAGSVEGEDLTFSRELRDTYICADEVAKERAAIEEEAKTSTKGGIKFPRN